MRPFNVYVEGGLDDLDQAVDDALKATFADDTDHGGADDLAGKLADICHGLAEDGVLGDNVTRYAVNVGAASATGSTEPDAVLDIVQLNVRALARGEAESSGSTAG